MSGRFNRDAHDARLDAAPRASDRYVPRGGEGIEYWRATPDEADRAHKADRGEMSDAEVRASRINDR